MSAAKVLWTFERTLCISNRSNTFLSITLSPQFAAGKLLLFLVWLTKKGKGPQSANGGLSEQEGILFFHLFRKDIHYCFLPINSEHTIAADDATFSDSALPNLGMEIL